MTLVACTIHPESSYPNMIGDILLTQQVEKSSAIPTSNVFNIDPYLPEELEFKPVECGQKLYILNDRICVAVAGYSTEIRDFLEDFRLHVSYLPNINFSVINEYVSNNEKKEAFKNSVAMILFYEKKKNAPGQFGLVPFQGNNSPQIDEFESAVFGKVFSAGSGKTKFNELVQYTVNPSGDIDPMMDALLNHLALIASCLAAESMLPSHTLKDYWGAGYELVYFNWQSFVKLDDVVYVIWKGHFDDMGNMSSPIPTNVYYYKYHGEVLLITSIEIDHGFIDEIDDSIRIVSKPDEHTIKVTGVPGLERGRDTISEYNGNLSFKTNTVATGYAMLTTQTTYTSQYVAINDSRTSVTYVTEGNLSPGTLEINIWKQVADEQNERIKEFYKNR